MCDLDWNDFRDIYQYGLPAGNFEECAYYLPRAFAYVRAQQEGWAGYLSGLIHFISIHADQLANANRTLDRVREALKSCFESWTANFEVIHRDRAACEEKGWGLQFQDTVINSENICELIDELCRELVHSDVAVAFIEGLASPDATTIQSAWYLELVREFNWGFMKGGTINNRGVLKPLRDKTLWEHHAAVVLDTLVPTCPSPTYWNDTLFFI